MIAAHENFGWPFASNSHAQNIPVLQYMYNEQDHSVLVKHENCCNRLVESPYPFHNFTEEELVESFVLNYIHQLNPYHSTYTKYYQHYYVDGVYDLHA